MTTTAVYMACDRCGGTGKVRDPRADGAEARSLREKAGLSLREVAAHMELSSAYLCDLEKGRRTWRAELQDRCRAAILALTK